MDKKILQKTYPFLQYFLVEVRRVELLSNEKSKALSTSLVYRKFQLAVTTNKGVQIYSLKAFTKSGQA